MHSLDFYMPYLFTFQQEGCEGMPNTNNKIEGTFTNLKKRLNVHSGMTEMSRKRLISEFFLALAATHGIKKQPPPQVKNPADGLCLSLCAALFLMELHPCGASLRFRPHCKDSDNME
ncbi:hypothetical protein HMPREF0645_0952 [Hallella bergensis DSM 17361]|uniref:Transposase n=2 Tax=Hallella bergensis TaxID=242750 RepID=D1PVG7_9BACT|nr:hypothetical protein HMPREF0645_0952 [Hallella bergensis DSM 17361]